MKILILAGGKGTRLWPISRNFKPKQFQKFFGEKTLLQITFNRALSLVQNTEEIFVSTNEFYFAEVKRQLPLLPKKNIILEPAFRERVAAFLLFFCYLSEKELNEPVIILPSDHLIKDENQFVKVLKVGEEFVRKHRSYILLFGEKPRYPEVGYGYIKKGKLIEEIKEYKFYEVKFFKEKPNLKRAMQFCKNKDFYWNTGIFIFVPKLIIKLSKKFVPDNWKIYQKIKTNIKNQNFLKIVKKEYLKMDVVSFDYSILENYHKNIVLPVNLGWSDIGSWESLKEALTGKEDFIKGNFIGLNSKNIMVYSTSPQLIATIGIKNLIVIVTEDVIFICSKGKSQEIKKLIEKLEKSKKQKFL